MKQAVILKAGLALAALAAGAFGAFTRASDHDDGESDLKSRALNLTDLYAFRESDQNASIKDENMILVMNTNPRSIARQQYSFSSKARYEFHVTRVKDKDAMASGKTDMLIRFEFSPANAKGVQEITVTGIRDGGQRTVQVTTGGKAITTTPLGSSPVVNQVLVYSAGGGISVFAGLREDPFFFDVEQFFRVRAGLAGLGEKVGFRSPGADFTAGYNVNAIVARVPMGWFKGVSGATTFDVWETISVPNPEKSGEWMQIERLGRPAVNEGLVLTNDYLNILNAVGPDFENAVLTGNKEAGAAAAPIIKEVSAVLGALGNDEKRTGVLLGAFLPDVMRIDTTGPSGYANALNKLGSPIRGRMIKDDVIDITLSVLSNGAVASDNTSYDGPNAGGTKHKPLVAEFPYLAEAN